MISSDFFRLLFDRELTIASEMLSEEYGLKTIDGFTTCLTYSLSEAIIKQPLFTASIRGRPRLSFKEGNIRNFDSKYKLESFSLPTIPIF
jgi:hypothetical protein